MGKRLPSTTPSMVLRLLAQFSIGPSGVLEQSIERTSLPISPPLVSQSAAGAPPSTAGSAEVGSFISTTRRLVGLCAHGANFCADNFLCFIGDSSCMFVRAIT
jgi:hypothetical protein